MFTGKDASVFNVHAHVHLSTSGVCGGIKFQDWVHEVFNIFVPDQQLLNVFSFFAARVSFWLNLERAIQGYRQSLTESLTTMYK